MEGPPHEILGVPEDAGEPEILDAYRELMKRYHPDRFVGRSSDEQALAKKYTQAINQARKDLIKKNQQKSR